MADDRDTTPVHVPAGLGRTILALAVPALGALIAEPLFLMADTAIVGHLGLNELAGAGLGTTVLQTAVGLMVFLAYSTTPAVARWLGARRLDLALAAGRDGLWLALALGVVLAAAGWFAGPALLAGMGATGPVFGFALDYLRWSMPGLPAMLLVLAATGVLRGLQDTKTPLLVAGAGFGVNIVLNFALVYGVGLSVAGSAIGTSIAQWAMAAVYLVLLVPRLRAAGVPLRPHVAGVIGTGKVGSWLMLRTLSLRVGILATVWVATSDGALTLAAHQLVFTIFTFMAFALDALAIAAQALIGKELGAGDRATAGALTRVMTRWGLLFGVGTGVVLALVAPVLGALFTSDTEVQRAAAIGLWVLAASQPLAGLVFVLDGVLIGAGDGTYLAQGGVVVLAVYAPTALVAVWLGGGLLAVWLAFSLVFLGSRFVILTMRARGERWLVTGANLTTP